MPKSEIDDIFASKGKAKAIQPVASSSTASKRKKKKDKGKKRGLEAANEPMTKKRPAPETVVDPSTQIPSAKRAKVAITTSKKPGKQDSSKDDEDRFKDSRGSGPRRKTEEGFSIFKEDELGIGGEGGDTPLCPFDCQCCF
ncbi:hypothetical protein PILCRDRAFT_817378 [Piloderma croceum F 1598]|uniref:DUF1764-domain-containing protein n=1 Tax=Piloderma croceum (strain F 1598) TaxID=765440 RepID=A0A0C3C6S3_PILCF|nr:hypothetical protein PILCRDRAFT_817378 [Piloderma croceum F 1598]